MTKYILIFLFPIITQGQGKDTTTMPQKVFDSLVNAWTGFLPKDYYGTTYSPLTLDDHSKVYPPQPVYDTVQRWLLCSDTTYVDFQQNVDSVPPRFISAHRVFLIKGYEVKEPDQLWDGKGWFPVDAVYENGHLVSKGKHIAWLDENHSPIKLYVKP